MGFFDMFDKIDDIILEPISAISDWIREPLNKWEHKRNIQSAKTEAEIKAAEQKAEQDLRESEAQIKKEFEELQAEIERKKLQAEKEELRKLKEQETNLALKKQNAVAEIERRKKVLESEIEQALINARSDAKEKEANLEIKKNESAAKIDRENKEHNTNLQIKRETEIIKRIAKIEQWKKNQEFERMKLVSESIVQYQKKLTQINTEAIIAIGEMQLDLKEKANNLVLSKTEQYNLMQSKAISEAHDDFDRAFKFPEGSVAHESLMKNIDKRLSNVINAASRFIDELNSDIRQLNNRINLLAESGQSFIENHLNRLQEVSVSDNQIIDIINSDAVNINAKDVELISNKSNSK
ncbi:MAG: hypothetical protein ACOCRX_11135 [Candidatus Woesearchaeota archaeon]